MLWQIFFVILFCIGLVIIGWSAYQLVKEYRQGGAAGHAPVPTLQYRGTQIASGILVSILAALGFRWARERRRNRQR